MPGWLWPAGVLGAWRRGAEEMDYPLTSLCSATLPHNMAYRGTAVDGKRTCIYG